MKVVSSGSNISEKVAQRADFNRPQPGCRRPGCSRRDCLRLIGQGTAALALFSAFGGTLAFGESSEDLSLRERAFRKGILFGSEAMKSDFFADKAFAPHFKRECAILVPGNELKWHFLRRTPDTFDFGAADWLAAFADDAELLLRGHTLIWGESLPPWFAETVNSKNAAEYLSKHIATVVGRYAGRMHSWDVVNEPINAWDGRPDGLSSTLWLKALGPDYLRMAFEAAAEADPHATLVLNQNYLEYDSRRFQGFREKTLQLLERLLAAKAPVHALGIQAHLRSDYGAFHPESFRRFLRDVAAMGLKILITELDVYDANLPREVNVRDRVVAEQYEEFLRAALDQPAVNTVITWGLADKYSWYVDYGRRSDLAPVRPLPLDGAFRRKPAWHAIGRALDSTFHR